MSESGISRADADAGPPRDRYYPIDSTHACGSYIKHCNSTLPLSDCIRRHKSKSPSCFDGSTIGSAYHIDERDALQLTISRYELYSSTFSIIRFA